MIARVSSLILILIVVFSISPSPIVKSQGGYVVHDCSDEHEQIIHQAMGALLKVANENFDSFVSCMANAPLVEVICNGGRDTAWELAAYALVRDFPTQIYCYDAEPSVLAEAYVGISGEELWIDRGFLTNGLPQDIAATIAHEIMHNRGYSHPDFGQPYYSNTVPEQVEACISTGIPNAAFGPNAWQICTSFDAGDSLAAADMDGNDTPEILVAEDNGGAIAIYTAPDGILRKTVYTSFDEGDDIAAGDINGDRFSEILVAEDDGGRINVYNMDRLLFEQEPGNNCHTTFDEHDGLAVGDTDGDRIAEVISTEDDGNVAQIFDIALGSRDACYQLKTRFDTDRYDRGDSLISGDIDGDGQAEIIVLEDDGGWADAWDENGTWLGYDRTSYDVGDDAAVANTVAMWGFDEILIAEDDDGLIRSYGFNFYR